MKIEMHWSDRFLSVTATVDSLEEATRVNHWLRSLGGRTTPAEDAPAWVTEDVVDAEEVTELAPTPAAAEVAAPAWVTEDVVDAEEVTELAPTPAAAEVAAPAPATPPVTRESVRAAVVNIFNVPEGRARIREILATFGVTRLSELPDEHLEAFAAASEKIQ